MVQLQDDEEFEPGKGVAEMIAKLESGQPLGPDPKYEDLTTESAEEFSLRMLKYRQAYEAQFLPKKDWKVGCLVFLLAINILPLSAAVSMQAIMLT